MEKYHIIKLLSDQNRFQIFMKLLEYDSLCVSELERLIGMKQANTSKHLRKFKEMNIVDSKRDGNLIHYTIKESFINDNMELIKYLMMSRNKPIKGKKEIEGD